MMSLIVWLAYLVSCVGTSVAELCQEGKTQEIAGDCFKFRYCLDGQWKEMSCTPPHQVFDLLQGQCVSTQSFCQKRTNHQCIRELCEPNPSKRCTNGQKKVLGCKLYSECISGEWFQVECKKGETVKEGRCKKDKCVLTSLNCREYTINGENMKCESGHYFDENLSKCTPGICKTRKNACEDGEAKRVKNTCKKYQKCIGGIFEDKECGQCQNFDEDSKGCVFVWDRPCKDGVISTTTKAPTTTTPVPTKCFPGKRKPDYGNCRHYFECDSEGNWQQKSCWWFFFYNFDVDSYSCKFWSAKCAK